MKRLIVASISIGAGLSALTAAADAMVRQCLDFRHCAGMELVQSPRPDGNSQDDNSAAPSDEGSGSQNSEPPRGNDQGDGGSSDDDGADTDQATPPDTAQPPGCIFRNEPLELLV